MKTNKIIGALTVAALAGSFTSCKEDYLVLSPESTIATEEVTATVEAAQLALNGLCNAMQTQYQNTSYNQYNGESYINTILGEGFGQDDLSGLALNMWGVELTTGGAGWSKDNYVLNWMVWAYAYNLIQQANQIIAGIDQAEGDDAERNLVKAQALTIRAHGYTRIIQFYAPRWEDSRNGDWRCAVYRVEPGIQDAPLCSMNTVYNDIIKKDLDTAIECFKAANEAGVDRDYKWQPAIGVAYGVYARAAMIMHDFKVAQEMAHNAQQGYTPMDNKTYFSGFCYDNDDFMWIQASEPADIYYWSWGAHHAVNGIYVKNWGEGAGAIDYQLYQQMDPNDVRRQMYLTPDKIKVLEAAGTKPTTYNPGRITEEEFWNPSLVVETSNCDLSGGPYKKPSGVNKGKPWGLYNVALRYAWYYGKNIFTGDYKSMDNQGFWAYYTIESGGKVQLEGQNAATLAKIPFGAQFKFWSIPPYGVSAYPFMRSTEMLLTEAEAACYNNDEATATALLTKLNKMRIPGYTLTATGDALLEEVILSRRIELWGEGFSWPDFKRWNRDIVRVAWEPNTIDDKPNPEHSYGNWMTSYAKTTEKTANYGWRMMIPRSEYEYNKGINRSELEK